MLGLVNSLFEVVVLLQLYSKFWSMLGMLGLVYSLFEAISRTNSLELSSLTY